MNWINKTPHEINIYNDDDELVLTLPRCQNPARCEQKNELIGVDETHGFNLYRTMLGAVTNAPADDDGNNYIVSSIVHQQLRGRKNVWKPGTEKRDQDGNVIGCYGLSQ